MQLIHYCSLSSTRFDSKRQKVRQQKRGNYIIPATTWQQVNAMIQLYQGLNALGRNIRRWKYG